VSSDWLRPTEEQAACHPEITEAEISRLMSLTRLPRSSTATQARGKVTAPGEQQLPVMESTSQHSQLPSRVTDKTDKDKKMETEKSEKDKKMETNNEKKSGEYTAYVTYNSNVGRITDLSV